MKVNFKIGSSGSFESLKSAIVKIADMESEIKKNHPDVVVNVEVKWN